MVDDALKNVFITLKTNAPIIKNEIKFWFTSLNYDEQRKLLSGNFHLATSVDDLYSAKVKFSY